MTDFGKCRRCDERALVKLNGEPLCLDDYRDELKRMSSAVKRSLCDELGLEYPTPAPASTS